MPPLLPWKHGSKYSEYAFVALGIQHAMSMRRIVTCGLVGYKIFFIFSQMAQISNKVIETKKRFDFLINFV